jgi:hypothetical protein
MTNNLQKEYLILLYLVSHLFGIIILLKSKSEQLVLLRKFLIFKNMIF